MESSVKAGEVVDELLRLSREVADSALEFQDDSQPEEAQRHRERAIALVTAACLVAGAYPETCQRGAALLDLACLSADVGEKDRSFDLLEKAERFASDDGELHILDQIENERRELELVQ